MKDRKKKKWRNVREKWKERIKGRSGGKRWREGGKRRKKSKRQWEKNIGKPRRRQEGCGRRSGMKGKCGRGGLERRGIGKGWKGSKG